MTPFAHYKSLGLLVALLASLFSLAAAYTPELPPVLPQLFSVVDVAQDDVLNIRAAPTVEAEIIGALEPDSRNHEIVALNLAGDWGMINVAYGAGWVFMRYLEPQGLSIDAYNMPETLHCSGTEPFWSLSYQDGVFDYSWPGEDGISDTSFQLSSSVPNVVDGSVRDDWSRVLHVQNGQDSLSLHLQPTQDSYGWFQAEAEQPSTSRICGDGMSEFAYGLMLHLQVQRSDDSYSPERLLRGCCSLGY